MKTLFAKNSFFLGSHLCREPMPPMPELKADMENLKNHGFNLIKIQTHWATDEAVEGEFRFERTEQLLEHAQKLGLQVYLGLTLEQAPQWLYRKYPDCRMVRRDGTPMMFEAYITHPGDGKPGPCFDHPGALHEQNRYIAALIKALGVYDTIAVWNTWQEIHYWAERLCGQDICYCAHTLEFFRSWLKEKYGSLDSLNSAWNTRFGCWEDIGPYRIGAGSSHEEIGLAVDIHWKYFIDNVKMAHPLKERACVIRENDPKKRPVFAHKAYPVIGSGADWTYARCQDFLGTSAYPAWNAPHAWDDGRSKSGYVDERHGALLCEIWQHALSFDYIRSANGPDKPSWAAEFQGGPIGGWHKGRVPSAEDIRRWMLTAVGSGVSAISFWVTRAEIIGPEMHGFSLLDSVGDTTERFEEAARIGQMLQRYPDLFGVSSRAPAQAGIITDEWNYQVCRSMGAPVQHLCYSARGWHRFLWEMGITMDFAEISYADANALDKYRMLILPSPLSISEESAQKLTHYVEHGGNLICEACPGRLDENAFATRGEISPAMRTLFGVSQKSFSLMREPQDLRRWTPEERTWGEYAHHAVLEGAGVLAGEKLNASVSIETFECLGSEPVLMHNGVVCGVNRCVGKGNAWLIGTYIGHSGTAYRNEQSNRAIDKIISLCGVKPHHDGALLLRRRCSSTREAWIFFNPTETAVTENVDCGGWKKFTNALTQKSIAVQDNAIKAAVESLDIAVIIAEK